MCVTLTALIHALLKVLLNTHLLAHAFQSTARNAVCRYTAMTIVWPVPQEDSFSANITVHANDISNPSFWGGDGGAIHTLAWCQNCVLSRNFFHNQSHGTKCTYVHPPPLICFFFFFGNNSTCNFKNCFLLRPHSLLWCKCNTRCQWEWRVWFVLCIALVLLYSAPSCLCAMFTLAFSCLKTHTHTTPPPPSLPHDSLYDS
jgi:hypothetical protein